MTRAHLLLTSALVLAAAPGWTTTGRAQTPPAPTELPTGMRVIAGQATASTQGRTLQVNQGSNRAALDWSSFNIGSQATVRFHDPSAQAMTLNRVSGPNASVIAGHLTSNGQMVLINQSGVVFMPGAVVDAQSVVVSASGITEAGMRRGVATGRFVLDQPAHPGAVVSNSGRISVARAGLAALVAPQVANHGRIDAAFGSVSLLGVTSHVVDLYGDGLLSIDVSRQTVAGADGQSALVTNDGVIAARGGTVTLSTDAIDGMVTNLVSAGGTIDTDGGGRQGGRVLIDAQGGVATVTGTLSARGMGRGASVGGEIAVQASERVDVASTAVIDASGRSGGGTVAIGTTLARARHGVGFAAPTTKLVGIAAGARVSADALVAGRGGQVTVLSSDNTVTEGRLTARGGALSGDGGDVEVSGTLGLSLLGVVDLTAAHGRAGSLTIDPTDLVVQSGGTATLPGGVLDVEPPPAGNTATIDPSVLQAASGNVTLISHDNIDVLSGFSINSNGLLTLTASTGTITVGGAITNNGGGIVMTAGSDIFIDAAVTASGSVNILAGGALTQAAGAPIASTGSFVALSAAGGLITLSALVSAQTSVNLIQATGVTQRGGGIVAQALFSSSGISGAVALQAGANNVGSLGAIAATGGFGITDFASTVTVSSPITVTNGALNIEAPSGAIAVQAALSTVGTGAISLSASTDITVSAPITAADALALTAADSFAAGSVVQLAGGALTSTNNAIALSASESIELNDNVTAANSTNGSLNVEHGVTSSLSGGVVQHSGSIVTPGLFSATGVDGSVDLPSAGNDFSRAGTLRAGGGLTLVDAASLLTIAGPLQAGTGQLLSITAPQLAFAAGNGRLSAAAGTIELAPTTGTVTLGAVGSGFSLTAADLSNISTGLLRIGRTAQGGLASSVTVGGSFDVASSGAASTLELDAGAGGIAINAGPLVAGATGTLLFGSPGGVTQAAGALVAAGTVAGIGTLGALELPQAGNTIGTLGPLDTGAAELNVATSGTLALAGPITTTGGATLTASGSISLTGALSVGTLSLHDDAGDVAWSTPFSATTITGSVDGNASLIDSNAATTTLGAFATSNNLTLTTSGALTTSGVVATNEATLSASGVLTIASAVSGFTIDLSATSLAEDTTLGSLSGVRGEGGLFGLLTSHGGIAGSATLLGANTLTDVGRFVAGGTLALLNTQSVSIDSGVGAASASLHVTNAGSIEIAQPLAIPQTGTLSLQADRLRVTGAATSDVVSNQTGGTIRLIAVAPDSAETVVLGGAALSGPGTLAISNGNFLLGALRANTLELGGLPDGSLTAANLVVQSTSLASGVTLLLDTDAAGGVTQTAALSVDALGGDVGSGGVLLTNAGNRIGAIDGLAVAGSAALVDAAPSLTVDGAFSAASTGRLAIAVDQFGFGAAGSLSAGTVAVGPRSTGRTLGIGDTRGAYDIELGDLSRIAASTLDAGSSGIPGSATAQSVVLAGDVDLAGSTLVLDAGSGGVAQSAGTLDVGTLAGNSAAGFFVADGGSNTIAALGAIQAISLDISSATGLQVTGLVAASGGALDLAAPSVAVQSGGGLAATGGTLGLSTDALSGFGAGAVVDTRRVVIAPFSNAALTVGPAAGDVDLSVISTGTIVLDSSSHGIVFSGAVIPGAGTLLLQAGNAPVTETASDSLTVGTLLGSAGSLSMPGGNHVGTLAGFTVGLGDFLLDDANLTVGGSVIANDPAAPQTITLQAPTLTIGAGVAFSVAHSSSSSGLVLQSDALLGAAVNASVPGGRVTLERLTPGAQSFAQTGGITTGTLQIGGSDLSSTSLTLGNVAGLTIGTLQLESGGSVTQTGSLVAPGSTLTGQAGSVLLDAAGNTLAALDTFTTTGGGFTLTDAVALGVFGVVDTSTGTLSLTDLAASGIGIALQPGSVLQAATLVLGAPDGAGVAQDATAAVTVASLDGAVTGDVLLDGTADAVAAIGTLSVGGQLRLNDTVTLTEDTTGTLTAGTLAGTYGGDLLLDGTANAIGNLGPLTASGTLTLTAADPTLAGLVTAAQMSFLVDGFGYSSGALVATGSVAPFLGPRSFLVAAGTVEIAPRTPGVLNLGTASGGAPFVSAGVLANIDASLLRLGRAGQQETATGIAVNAPVAVSSALPADEQVAIVDLQATGPVTEAAGATFGVPATLTGNTGAVSLTGGANAVPVLGAYTTNGGGFALDDGVALAVEGDVVAGGITLAVAGALSLDAGSLIAPGGTVDLTATGGSEGAGIIAAAMLDSSGTPGTFTLAGANQVDALGAWNASGALTLVDDTSRRGPAVLTVAGPVEVTALTLQAASIALTGDVDAGAVASLSTTAGGVTQSGGTLQATLLTSPGVAGDVLLGSVDNAVTSLGAFSVPGHSFTLADSVPLGVTDALTATAVTLADPTSVTVSAMVAAPAITVRGGALAIVQNGALVATGGTVDLVATGATESGNGLIRAATLLSGGTPSGAFVLGGANSIDTLGGFQMASGGSLLLVDDTPLTIAGAVSAASVDVSTIYAVAETTGSISAGLLSSSFGVEGGMTLENPGNAIAALGNISTGAFILEQSGSLEVLGSVATAANTVIRIGGALTIDAGASLSATDAIDLTADGAVEAMSGEIAATLFESSQGASGNWFLTGTNRIGYLGPFTDNGGALILSDLAGLQVAGPIGVGFLGLAAASVTLAGDITAAGMQVTTSAGGLTQTAGLLSVGLLTAPDGLAGAVSLPDANQIGAFGSFVAQGTVAVNDSTDLAINGAVSAPGGLALSVAGTLTEGPQGSVAAALLSGSAAAVTLTQSGNAVGTLDFTTSGSLALADGQSLTVARLSDLGASLSVTGDLTLTGAVIQNQALLTLNATGAVTQSAGVVTARQLDGTANSFSLTARNAIAELANISAPGGFTLVDGSGLALFGPVQGGVIDLSVAAGGIVQLPDGILSGTLRSTGGVVGDTLLTAANQLSAVGPLIDQGVFALNNARALTIGNVGASTLDLSTSAGGISQSGPVSAAVLQSSAGIVGAADFADAGNRIGILGPMTVTGGNLTLADATGLTLAGRLIAPDASLTVGGAIAQTGDVLVSGTLSTDSLGTYTRTGGALQVGTLTGRAVSLADFGTAAAVQRIGAFTVDDADDGFPDATEFSNFALSDTTGLTLAGPLASDYIRISATGALVWSGDLITLGLSRLDQSGPTPSNPGSYLQVTAGADGSAQIQQTGVVHVISQDAFLSTVRLQTPAIGGSVVLNDLEAPQTDLLVFIGTGRASGRIDVGNLLVSGAQGGTSFVGTVRGLVGQAAARASSLAPLLSANYRVNSCPIGSVNCILLPVETVPQQNPLRDLAIGQARDELDDTDVLLPNVAEQDY